MQLELVLDRGVISEGVGAVERLGVEHVHEQPSPLDVGEELVTEPRTSARPLDQPRYVRDDELAIVRVERAERGLEGGEGIVGDLRMRPCEARQQR